MSCYVDPLFVWPAAATRDPQARRVAARNHQQWCHLGADTPAELQAMALQLGLKPGWLQLRPYRHYDLTPGRRWAAVRAGAIELSAREFVRRLRAAESPPDAATQKIQNGEAAGR